MKRSREAEKTVSVSMLYHGQFSQLVFSVIFSQPKQAYFLLPFSFSHLVVFSFTKLAYLHTMLRDASLTIEMETPLYVVNQW